MPAAEKSSPSTGFKPGQSGNPKGRPKGVPNKTTSLLKDALLQAAEQAGGEQGLVGYLTEQAEKNPAAFMTLLGKVLPMQVTGPGDGPLETVTRIELVAPAADTGYTK